MDLDDLYAPSLCSHSTPHRLGNLSEIVELIRVESGELMKEKVSNKFI